MRAVACCLVICTVQIAVLAQQHHVGLERIKRLVKAKGARFMKVGCHVGSDLLINVIGDHNYTTSE